MKRNNGIKSQNLKTTKPVQLVNVAKLQEVCDQLGDALEEALYSNSTEIAIEKSAKALEAWRELK